MFLYGVVNASPDSLNVDSIALDATAATRRGEYLLNNGCNGIDLGGQGSTEARNLWMGTFHSVFARILRAEADKLGYPKDFTIYDSDDSRSVFKGIVKEWQLVDKLY